MAKMGWLCAQKRICCLIVNMTPFEITVIVVIVIAGLLCSAQQTLKRVLPSPVYSTMETAGVLTGVCASIMLGGAGGNVGSSSGLSAPHVSHSEYNSLASAWRSREFSDDHHRGANHHNYDNQYHSHRSHTHTKRATKRNVSETLKKVVAANQQWRCGSCNRLLSASYEIDHYTPLAEGGSNEASNLVALCRECHGQKSIGDRLRWNGEW